MCAGDLGMYRVMPWAYPPISGGTSGGFSPDGSTSEGGGSGGGSTPDPNAVFVRTAETKSELYSIVFDGSKIDLFLHNSMFGIGSLIGLSKINAYFVVDEVYNKVDPSTNIVGRLSNDTVQIWNTKSYTDLINWFTNTEDAGTSGISVPFAVAQPYENGMSKVVGHFHFDGLNSDGVIIRSNDVDADPWVAKS